MGLFIERIQVIVEHITKGMANLQANNKEWDKTRLLQERLDMQWKKMQGSARGLTMALLSTLFFARMMSGAMFGMLKPAAQALGIFDLFQTLLVLLFLPIMLQLLPHFLDLFNYLADLSPETKILIGWIVLLAGAFFTFLGAFISLALPVTAWLAQLGGMPAGITALKTAVAGFLPTALSLETILGGLVGFAGKSITLYFAVKGIQDVIAGGQRAVTGVLELLYGLNFLIGPKLLGVAGAGVV